MPKKLLKTDQLVHFFWTGVKDLFFEAAEHFRGGDLLFT